MERINLTELISEQRDSALEVMLISAMTHATDEARPKRDFIETFFPGERPPEGHIVDVELKINGVEVPFSLVLEKLLEGYDEVVTRAARDMIIDRVHDLMDVLNEVEDKLRERFKVDREDWG